MNRSRWIVAVMASLLSGLLVACGGSPAQAEQAADTAALPAQIADTVDVDVLKQAMVGRFRGELPCADCSGIDTDLTLNADMSYQLSETYLGKGKPFVSTGKWNVVDGTRKIEIDYDKPGQGRYYQLAGKHLQMLDSDGNPVDSKLNYTLTRQ